MPLWRGSVAAGQPILTKIKPAFLTHYGRIACLVSGLVVLSMSSGFPIGMTGAKVAPIPPKKPEAMTIAIPAPTSPSNPAVKQTPYRSPFGGEQMEIYRDIFRLQADGKMDEAKKLFTRLKDDSLMGHILAQRYLHPDYKAQFDELRAWMERYAELPEAARIKRLASIRAPSGYKGSLKEAVYQAGSIVEMETGKMAAKAYHPKIKRSKAQEGEAAAMIRTIRKQIRSGEPTNALATLRDTNASLYIDDVEKDRLRALIASGYMHAGNADRARELSGAAFSRSRGQAPMAGWVYGLSMWRAGNYAKAASAFETTAYSPYSNGSLTAAASFWAARAHDKAGNSRKSSALMERAAEYPRTFYGLLALGALDKTPDFDWSAPKLTPAQEKAILSTSAGLRAEKLIAAGEITLAEAEIKSLYVTGNHERKKALLAYAYDRQLPSLTLKLAHAISSDENELYDAALYPAMPWQPKRGYRIDRALIHAITRQESRFNALAQNKSSGATGLMQLMPRTATYMAGDNRFDDQRHLLKDPEISLDIGQKYVEYLLNNSLVGQDLLSLAIAYNAGPGTLQKWKEERKDITDPLLFIETIPYAETRNYVQRVLSNYWIYRMRFDQSNESMQALANGHWARYASLDKGAVKFAEK